MRWMIQLHNDWLQTGTFYFLCIYWIILIWIHKWLQIPYFIAVYSRLKQASKKSYNKNKRDVYLIRKVFNRGHKEWSTYPQLLILLQGPAIWEFKEAHPKILFNFTGFFPTGLSIHFTMSFSLIICFRILLFTFYYYTSLYTTLVTSRMKDSLEDFNKYNKQIANIAGCQILCFSSWSEPWNESVSLAVRTPLYFAWEAGTSRKLHEILLQSVRI